ncbi:hypothetical protein VNO77_18914 [Canavalia gladiata]|uniref:Uncharacterized protein n=1 Tax=Canavalia gladiata TaxID=3824 RepID=A0AAN9LQD9_CANGL
MVSNHRSSIRSNQKRNSYLQSFCSFLYFMQRMEQILGFRLLARGFCVTYQQLHIRKCMQISILLGPWDTYFRATLSLVEPEVQLSELEWRSKTTSCLWCIKGQDCQMCPYPEQPSLEQVSITKTSYYPKAFNQTYYYRSSSNTNLKWILVLMPFDQEIQGLLFNSWVRVLELATILIRISFRF